MMYRKWPHLSSDYHEVATVRYVYTANTRCKAKPVCSPPAYPVAACKLLLTGQLIGWRASSAAQFTLLVIHAVMWRIVREPKFVHKKGKVAHTRLPSAGFRSWSRFLAVTLQVTWVRNPAVGCHYFPPGLQLPPQPLRVLVAWYQFRCLVNRGTMCVNSLPKTVTRQRRGCDLNPGHYAPESSTLTTRLPSHSSLWIDAANTNKFSCHSNVPWGIEKRIPGRLSTAIIIPTLQIWRRSVWQMLR